MQSIAEAVRAGLAGVRDAHPDWFIGIRQDGVVLGLEFAHPQGAKAVMRRLYEHGVWAIFSTLDPSVLQYKPGLLLGPEQVEDMLQRTAAAVAASAADPGP